MEALNAHDGERIQGALSPTFTFEDVAGEGRDSADAFLHWVGMLFGAFPDLTLRAVRLAPDGDRLVAEFRAMGTHRATFVNVAPTDAFIIFSGVLSIVPDGDVVRSLRATIDFAGLRRQLLQASRQQKNPPGQ